jgi:hypothetical protein
VPPHDHDGADDDGNQQSGPDRRRDHARIDPAAEHRRDLGGERDLVHERVTPDAEHDVREDQVEDGMTVPAMPDGEPVEAHEPLDPGEPGKQQDLDQCEVRRQ